MHVKDAINGLIQKNEEVYDFIQASYRKGADGATIDYVNFLKESNYNSALSLSFTDILQFCSDPNIYEQFELKDIEEIFDSFLKLSAYCTNIYIDAANFSDSVMDNKQKAKEIIEIRIKELKDELHDLEELSKHLNLE